MTKRQRKNRKRINRLVEHWPELFNREKPKPLKVVNATIFNRYLPFSCPLRYFRY